MDSMKLPTSNMTCTIVVSLILNLAVTTMLQATCREEICLRADDILVYEGIARELGENKTDTTRPRGYTTSVGHNEVTGLSECQCNSEVSCIRKCCSPERVLDKSSGRCIDAEIFVAKRDPPEQTPTNILLNNVTSDEICFGPCSPGKSIFISEVGSENSTYIHSKSGEFCTSHENVSLCLKPEEFCIDYVSSARGLSIATCQNTTAERTKKPTWKGYSYPSPIMPLMIGVMLGISSLSLSVTFLVYSCFRELRNLHGKCLLCHMGSLIVYYVVIIVRRFRTLEMRHNGFSCFALDVSRYYFYLAPFAWLNVTCFDISMSFINLRPRHGSLQKREWMTFAIYSLYSWTTPVAAFILSVHIDLNSKGLDFSDININEWCKKKHFTSSYYRYVPMSLFMGLSVGLFVATAIKIYRINHSTSILRSEEHMQRNAADRNKEKRFKLYAKLLVVMGFLSWVMEPIFWAVHEWMVKDRTDYRSTMWFVMLVIRNLQGLYISVVFLWNNKVRVIVKKMASKRPGQASDSTVSQSHELSSFSRPELSTQIADIARNSTASSPNG